MLYGCFFFKFVFYVYKNDYFKIFFCFVVAVSEQFHILEFSFSIIFFTNPKIIEFSFVACFLLVLGTLICFLRFYLLGTNLSFSTEGFYFYNFLFRSRFFTHFNGDFLPFHIYSKQKQLLLQSKKSFTSTLFLSVYWCMNICMYVWVCVSVCVCVLIVCMYCKKLLYVFVSVSVSECGMPIDHVFTVFCFDMYCYFVSFPCKAIFTPSKHRKKITRPLKFCLTQKDAHVPTTIFDKFSFGKML